MKIGQFAKLNEVSINTIRHYMDMGLIVPEKKGGQYHFDNRCQEDLEMIAEFKAMGFQLNEIKLFFFYKNIGKWTDYEEDAYYQSLFLTKRDKVEKEINALQKIKEKLDGKLEQLSKKNHHSKANTGIQIHSLHLLKCSNCGQSLSLENGSICQNQVIEGILSCGCEFEHTIQSGIIIVNQPFIPSPDDLQLESHMNEYIIITDSDYLQNIYNSLQWSKRKLDGLNLQQKVLLELGTGVGIFLRNMYDDLPEDCLYIAVDHNLEKLRFLKGILESTSLKRNVLFICADFVEIPIVHRSIDILIDHTGSSNYSFENECFLLKKVNHLINENGYLLGAFFIFNVFSSNSKIAPKVRPNFSLPIIQNHIVELKYELIEEKASEILNHGGKYEDFFVKGEEVYTYSYFGKRSG